MILMTRYLIIAIIVCLNIHSFDRVDMHTLFIIYFGVPLWDIYKQYRSRSDAGSVTSAQAHYCLYKIHPCDPNFMYTAHTYPYIYTHIHIHIFHSLMSILWDIVKHIRSRSDAVVVVPYGSYYNSYLSYYSLNLQF